MMALTSCHALSTNYQNNPGQKSSSHTQAIVIAHRGASGYLPEHTLESAILAYSQGADFIEQDLVLSKDGVLMILHDIHLELTTDVELKFPNRARKDGRYYAIDFTLTELKTLTVHERQTAKGKPVYPNRYTGNAPFKLATFEEQIVLIQTLNQLSNKQIGFYPEIKSPAWHRAEGYDISELTLTMLRKYSLDDQSANVYLQCFNFNEIKRLKNELEADVKLVQLLGDNSWQESADDYNYLRSKQGLIDITNHAVGIGPWLGHIIDSQDGVKSDLINNAKRLGLQVHPYTFRVDSLPKGMSSEQTLNLLFNQLEVDGLFTDQSDVVREFLDNH